ncbi:glutathionylspermidine synthase family protein [Kineosporia sp. J2-2]|uniref:Glutathionylspermidine synthase family protein n=1 Tax=Kineosporia corallincola TaxID=2835133 RepID=A0ABS5TJ61_9ACTN|nr:glutathionylspermidine synthase family protein [Kineosporia corallincola]MBT0770873.1 glutathionylspermidine synthase family protein [Kineosporia corallincola]
MMRLPQTPRPDAYRVVEEEGLAYARERNDGDDDQPYWFEGAAYRITEGQADELERVTDELHAMAMHATRVLCHDTEALRRLGIPEYAWPHLRRSTEENWSLYGRFDLLWDGYGPPKMLEYNADTPAALVETAVTQWSWLEAVQPDRDQWNMLHERLVRTWQKHLNDNEFVHLVAGVTEPLEDWNTIAYVADTVREAGGRPITLPIDQLGVVHGSNRFVGLENEPVTTCFAMYPWDWMLAEDFGCTALASDVTWLEPVHKVLTGSKALLATMWELYEGHPNLLPAYWSPEKLGREYVVKPVHGWEGAGVRVVRDGQVVAGTEDRHTAGQAAIYQQYQEIPRIGDNLPVLGTWVVGGHAAGLGIRETDAGRLITDTQARFVPHFIDAPRTSEEQVRAWIDEDE